MHLYIKLAFCLALQTDKLSIVNCQYVYEKIQGGYRNPTLNREAGYELPVIYWVDVFVPRFFVHSMIQIKPISFSQNVQEIRIQLYSLHYQELTKFSLTQSVL